MGSLKLEHREIIKREKEKGQDVIEMGEQKIRELEEHRAFNQIEAIDDEDISSVMDCGGNYEPSELIEKLALSEEEDQLFISTESNTTNTADSDYHDNEKESFANSEKFNPEEMVISLEDIF